MGGDGRLNPIVVDEVERHHVWVEAFCDPTPNSQDEVLAMRLDDESRTGQLRTPDIEVSESGVRCGVQVEFRLLDYVE